MAHLTNFSFELFYEIFTVDASQLLLYHGSKKSKMTKNPYQWESVNTRIVNFSIKKCTSSSSYTEFDSNVPGEVRPVGFSCFFSFFFFQQSVTLKYACTDRLHKDAKFYVQMFYAKFYVSSILLRGFFAVHVYFFIYLT